MARTGPIRRVSVARTLIFVGLLAVAVLGFTPFGGPFRILFRGVLVVGVIVLVGSYLWPWVRRFLRRD